MRIQNIEAALRETARFQKTANLALGELRREIGDSEGTQDCWITGTKKSGALRRASLDLSRSLSDMRKP